uniref:Lipase G, endothelial type n=1 Tax=Naja naja TaxID=35670 RepID=A0A8C6XYU6_NAJNA
MTVFYTYDRCITPWSHDRNSDAWQLAAIHLLQTRLKEEPSKVEDLQVKFIVRTTPDSDHADCSLIVGQDHLLDDCNFNVSAKTFFVIHGWSVSGMYERWLSTLVSALQEREKEANVVVVNWLSLAQQLYTIAVNNTRVVGKQLAELLDWLEKDFQLENVHLIGYSLGAHIAGYTGNYARGTIGRITGLDPAGPMFEGADPSKRLSPDDADFVDVLHTYTRETLGISIGIQMPVGHIDIYPNGGDIQPGCGLTDILGTLIGTIVICEHERSDKPSFAFQCTDSGRFKKGICLSCRKNRCNSIGYNTKKTRNKRNSKMYLKTRAGMPFKVFHYQLKIHVFSYKSLGETVPAFSVTFYGTSGNSEPLPLEIGLNYTNTFLVCTGEDVGDILRIKLTWEITTKSWYNLWKLQIRRIRVKSGETQKNQSAGTQEAEKRWGRGQSEVVFAGSPNDSKFPLLVLQNWSEPAQYHLCL